MNGFMSLDRFRKVFSIIPESEKKKPVIVIDDKTFTWEDAHQEILKNTEMGKQIQRKLEELNII